MLILGIDPGKATGITVMDLDQHKVLEAIQVDWDEWVLGNMMEHYLTSYDIDLIVCESFIPRWGQKFDLDSVYLIGALKATVDNELLQFVAPSAHKSLIKRDWAKQLVLEAGYKIQQGHKVDSTSLCLYAGIVHKNQTTIKELAKWLSKNSK